MSHITTFRYTLNWTGLTQTWAKAHLVYWFHQDEANKYPFGY